MTINTYINAQLVFYNEPGKGPGTEKGYALSSVLLEDGRPSIWHIGIRRFPEDYRDAINSARSSTDARERLKLSDDFSLVPKRDVEKGSKPVTKKEFKEIADAVKDK